MTYSASFLTDADVNLIGLQAHLQQLGIPAEVDDDNDLRVRTPAGRIIVRLLQDSRLLLFKDVYSFRADAGVLQRLQLINRMNREAMLPRFLEVDQDDDGTLLVAEYGMSYEHGLIPNQFAWVLQQFAHQTSSLLRQWDTDDLVE